jgi:hypothetical protein
LVVVLVHGEIEAVDLPDPLQYLEIEAPDTISAETATWNILVNPRHPKGSHVQVVRVHSHRIDAWLL